MQQQFNWSATSLMLVALTASVSVVADAVKAETPVTTANPESQLIREVGNDPLNIRVVQPVAQVTSVSQLSDVRPTDWAFTALQSLVERYNCIAGYPDRTYRGQQAMTRYEFAAGLNACLDKVNEIIAAGLADKVSKDDLEAIARLQEDFAAELASLKGRVDTLEGKVSTLERQQFSTTTKLNGEVIFAVAGGVDNTGTVDRTNIAFSSRVRLNFDTSFTGKDLLRTRLQASSTANFTGLGSGNSTRLSFDGFTNGGSINQFDLNKLFYRFNIGDARVWVAPNFDSDDVLDPLNPIASDGQGTVSRFGRRNPLLRIGTGGGLGGTTFGGIGVDFKLSPQGNLQLLYGANGAAAATGSGGLFGGSTIIAAQLVWKPASNLDLGIGYGYSSTTNQSLGTSLNGDSGLLGPGGYGIKANTISGNLVWRFAPKASFFTWGSFTFADTDSAANLGRSGTFTSWLAGLAFNDLISSGDRASVFFGQPLGPSSLTNVASVSGVGGSNLTNSYHLEAFYNFRLTRNISITPGVFFVFNPNNDNSNGTATVGVLRTTFTF